MSHKNATSMCRNPRTEAKVALIIDMLLSLHVENDGEKATSVDGETMEYILEQVGMEGQMLTQLVMGAENREGIDELLDESDKQWRNEFNKKLSEIFGGKK